MAMLAILLSEINRTSVVLSAYGLEMTESPTTGERLRSRRRALNITATELGRRAALIMGRSKPISASAVRNQENGTNGLPMAVAEAYADVLKVDPQWLLFGDRDLSPLLKDRDAYREAVENTDPETLLSLEDIRIPTYGIISGRWLPEMVNSEHTELDNDLWLHVPGWSNAEVIMSAYEVADHSLEPVFAKGTWLIAAPHTEAVMNDGTIIVANKQRGDEIHQSVRMLKAVKDGVDLIGLGSSPAKTEPLIRNEQLLPEVYVTDAIIAAVRFLPGGTGRPLDARTPFEPDYLAAGNEALAQRILSQARAIEAGMPSPPRDDDTTE